MKRTEVGNRGLASHIKEEVVLDSTKKANIRGKLIFAVKTSNGELIEINSGDEIGLRHAYPITSSREGHYLKSYSVK